MGFDELAWVREVIDRWLTANGSTSPAAVFMFAFSAGLLFGN
ncbi:MAG: hypothetical protein U1E43_09540 [Rhodospirillales bacterium]